jgi:hypothetical protein
MFAASRITQNQASESNGYSNPEFEKVGQHDSKMLQGRRARNIPWMD